MKKIFFKISLLSLIVLQIGCDSGGGGSGSSYQTPPPGWPGTPAVIKPTSDLIADDDFDGIKNIDDCAPLDATKKILVYVDNDRDSFGTNVTAPICAGSVSSGYSINNLDCLDSDNRFQRWVFYDSDSDGYGDPNQKSCNNQNNAMPSRSVDNNFDNNDSVYNQNLLVPNYKDADADGFGTNEIIGYSAGLPGLGSSLNPTDCDDNNSVTFRIATVYTDADGDGYGSGSPQTQCIGSSNPAGYVSNTGDCSDGNSSAYFNQYRDVDGDGFGSGPPLVCTNSTLQSGKSFSNSDCDDNDANKKILWNVYADVDNDSQGFGSVQSICGGFSIPAGKVNNNLDCDDSSSQLKYFTVYYDSDNDGFGAGPATNICTAAIVRPYVTNNSDCSPDDWSSWKEINLAWDDDGDNRGNVADIKKICTGRTVNMNLVSNNTDYFSNDFVRYLQASPATGSNGKTNLTFLGRAPVILLTDASGNKLSVSQTGIGNYCDPATGVCSDHTNFCVLGLDRCLVITKRNSSNVMLWQKLIKVSASEHLSVKTFKLSSAGEFIITGNLSGTVDFDPGAPVISYSSMPLGISNYNMYLLKLSGNGVYVDHKVNSQPSAVSDYRVDASNNMILTGYTNDSYNFGAAVSPAGSTRFIGTLQDNLTFSNLKFSQTFGQYFLSTTSQYPIMIDVSNIANWINIYTYDTNYNYISQMPVQINCTTSCRSTQNARGKIFTIFNGTSYEFEPNTGVIEVKSSIQSNIKFVMYDSTEKIVYAGLFESGCVAGSLPCWIPTMSLPTSTHDWTGLGPADGFIIIGNKNYFWKNSAQSFTDLVSADGQTFILKGNVPQLSGGRIPYMYSNTTQAVSTSSAFNINKGFMWSILN